MAEPMSAVERGKLGAQKRWEGKQTETGAELPKWRITATCYLNDRIYDPELQPKDDNGDPKPLFLEIDTEYPSWYMEPANAAAEAVCERHAPAPVSDINAQLRISPLAP